MTERTIRRAVAADAHELARLISALGYAVTPEAVATVWPTWSAEGNFALVVPGEGALLGAITSHRMLVLQRAETVGRITALVVDPAARGRGPGRALLEAAEVALALADCGLEEVTSHALTRTRSTSIWAMNRPASDSLRCSSELRMGSVLALVMLLVERN